MVWIRRQLNGQIKTSKKERANPQNIDKMDVLKSLALSSLIFIC